MGSRFKFFWLPIGIASWTIFQSIAHAWWIVYGRELIACNIKVKRRVEFYMYMTYLYGSECDTNALDDYVRISFQTTAKKFPLELASLYNDDGTMTELLMNLYLGFDAFWIICAVALLVGVIMRLKQYSAVIFYLPWIFTAIGISAIDLFSALYFGFQIPKAEVIETTLPWNLPMSAVMAIVSGRLGLIWIVNLLNTFYICWFTRVVFKQRYAHERRSNSPHLYRAQQEKFRRQITENRIRSWQQFYGGEDDNFDYSSTFKELEDYNDRRRKPTNSVVPAEELCSTFKSMSSLSSNASSNTGVDNGSKKRVHITELVSYLPWSYTDASNKLFSVPEDSIHNNTPDKHSDDEDDDNGSGHGKVEIIEPSVEDNLNLDEGISRF